MLSFLARRLFMLIPMLVGISLITFLVIHLAPGEPVEMQVAMNPKVSKESRDRLRKFYGLDRPLHVQYVDWAKRIAHFDLGRSFSSDNRPVVDKIKERLPVTIGINFISILIEFALSIPIGIIAATRRDSFIDKGLTVFVFIGFSIPTFWLALLLMYIFGVQLNVLPISGLHSLGSDSFSFFRYLSDMVKHLVLPVIVGTFGSLAGVSRFMRSTMLEVIKQDYITTARAKGLSESVVIYKHALRNALLPLLTIIGFSVPGLIGGSVIFETIYAVPGMGQLFYQSVMARDYPVVMGILLFGSFLTLLGNIFADFCYALADPRIKHR